MENCTKSTVDKTLPISRKPEMRLQLKKKQKERGDIVTAFGEYKGLLKISSMNNYTPKHG